MLRAVTNALSYGNHLMVEAGTGVGKSFAYLVPAALFALQNNTRVVVSTNTINLQDQLIQRDLPNLCQALDLDFRFAVLKGRSNYLCPRRLENLRHYGPRTTDEMRVLAKVMVWQLNNQSGDRSELNLTGPTEREVWVRVSAEDDACTTETCIKRTGGACPFHRAKTMSQSAHVLVVNHALLLSDVATGSKVLPEYSHLIIDEGHHLETATTNALSFKLNQFDLERMMKEVGGSTSGVLGRLLTETQGGAPPLGLRPASAKGQPRHRHGLPPRADEPRVLQHRGRIRAACSAKDSRNPITPGRCASSPPHGPCPAGMRWRSPGIPPARHCAC